MTQRRIPILAQDKGSPVHDTGEASGHFQAPDKPREFRYKSGISGNQPLRCERVNEVTFKITAGEMSRVPAAHGQWGGYNTTRALAWVICIHPGLWLARCGEWACGPEPFNRAKADAVAMAKGMTGCFDVGDPIDHLNRVQALLADLTDVGELG
jgi:hypothetical protein